MLIDAFTYFNEANILDFRLKLLYPITDMFVIVEAGHTHSGKPKPWNFEQSKDQFAWAMDKIVYVKYEVPKDLLVPYESPEAYDPAHICWQVENAQRNAIADAVGYIRGDAFIMIGDVDEIPNPDAVQFLLDNKAPAKEPVGFVQEMFYYNLKNLFGGWNGTVMTTVGEAKIRTPQGLRNNRSGWSSNILGGGWHLSYFGSPEKVREKVVSFAHQEYNRDDYTNEELIAKRISGGNDPFDRYMKSVPKSPAAFPPEFIKYAKEEWW